MNRARAQHVAHSARPSTRTPQVGQIVGATKEMAVRVASRHIWVRRTSIVSNNANAKTGFRRRGRIAHDRLRVAIPRTHFVNTQTLFDRTALARNRLRGARHPGGSFLFDEVARRLADRLLDVQRTFPLAADLSGRGDAGAAFRETGAMSARGIDRLVALTHGTEGTHPPNVVADQELLPFRDASLDLAVSVLSLHAANDLPGLLVQVRRALKPDGFFLAAMFGGETLHELRHCLTQAEVQASGGVSPRIMPFADVRDLGSLLQRTGFALPVTDLDRITVTHTDMFALMHDLRAMGEANPLAARLKHFTRRGVMLRAAEFYRDRFAEKERIRATFDIVYLTGWAPHESQQQPLRPGSANARLADALDTTERSAGEKTGKPR